MVHLIDTIGDCGLFTDGDWVESKDQDPTGEVRLLQLADVGVANFVDKSKRFMTSAAAKRLKCTFLKEGDIMIARMPDPIGRSCIFPGSNQPCVTVVDVCILRVDPAIADVRYLNWAINSTRFQRGIAKFIKGTTRKRISRKNLEQLKIPLPPLAEQRRIAAILDQADAVRRKSRESLSRLANLGQGIFDDMFGDPLVNPKSFPRAMLGEIIDFVGGSQPPKSTFLYEDGPDRIRLVQIRDFRTDNYKTYVPKNLAKRPFAEKDVMIGRYGPPVFQIFRGLSGTYNVALMKAKPAKGITEDFVFYLLREPKLHNFVVANSERTAGQSGVNLNLLQAYSAFRPPEALQAEFSRRISRIDQTKNKLNIALNHAETLFASLQHRAFLGEL